MSSETIEATDQPSLWRRLNRLDKFVIIAIGFGVAIVVYGLMIGVTGDDRANIPERIESIRPVSEAVQVPAQSKVSVDLIDGYTGTFTIDGVEIETISIEDIAGRTPAGQQVELPPVTIFEPGNNTLTYTPTDAGAISSFETGEHQVTVTYWPIIDGPRRSRTFTWTFNVV